MQKKTILFRRLIMMALPFILLVLSFFMMIPTTAVWAATYYVDATSGNNSNNGLSTGLPWKTIAKVNSFSFSPGDSILFKKGETWRETLIVPSSGSAGNVITFGAYGSGANPIITGSTSVTGFAQSGSIWDVTLSTRPYVVVVGSTHPHAMSASRGALAAPGDWFWTANTLSVYATNDPSGTVEAGARDNPINTNNKIYLTFDGLTVRGANLPYSSSHGVVKVGYTTATGITIQNCTIENGSSTGIDMRGSSTATDFTIKNSLIQYNGGFGIWVNDTFNAGTISGNTIIGNGWASVADNQQFSGIQGHLGNVNISENTINANAPVCNNTGQCHGIYVLVGTAVANIYQNTIYNQATRGNGIKLIGSSNVYRNTIYGNDGAGIELGQNSSTNVAYSINYNLIYSNNKGDSSSGIVEQSKGTGRISLTVENNTLYQNGNTTQQELKVTDNLNALTVKNNLFYATSTRRTFNLATQSGTVAIDNNLHWRADGNPNLFYGGTGKTWAQWKGLGYDTHGVNSDPILVSPAAANFSLQSTSPAINAGTDVGLSMDIAGQHVPYGAAPDIGAYGWSPLPSAPRNLRVVP